MTAMNSTSGVAACVLAMAFVGVRAPLRLSDREAQRTPPIVGDSLYRLARVEDLPLPATVKDYLTNAHRRPITCSRTWYSGTMRLSGKKWSSRDSTTVQCPGEAARTEVAVAAGTLRERNGLWVLFTLPTSHEPALEVNTALVVRDTLYLNSTGDVKDGDVYLRDRRRP